MNRIVLSVVAAGAMVASIGAAHAERNNGGLGADGVCKYAGQEYSTGSKINLPNGTVLVCNADGTWSGKRAGVSPNVKGSTAGVVKAR